MTFELYNGSYGMGVAIINNLTMRLAIGKHMPIFFFISYFLLLKGTHYFDEFFITLFPILEMELWTMDKTVQY